MYDNRTDSNLQEIGDRVFVQDTTNWQVTHTLAWRANVVNQFRVGRVSARADQKGIPCPQSDVDSLQLTGVFTNIPDDQRECPQVGIQGYSGVGGAGNAYSASNQPMWDISNTTTWIHGSHQFNFGLNYRSWQLQRDLATGPLGGYGFNIGFTGSPVADFLLGYYGECGIVPAGRVQRAGAGGQSPRVQLQVHRAVHPGRLEGDAEPYAQPRTALGLPQRAVRDAESHGVAQSRLRTRRTARGRRVPRRGRHHRRRLLPVCRASQPRKPRPLQSLCAARGICLAAVHRRENRRAGRLRPVLRFR